METTLYVLLFILGLIIGSILFSTLRFPIFYMLPKAIYYSIKGQIKPISILVSLKFPAVVMVIGVMIAIFFPKIISFLDQPSINNGGNIAGYLLFISCFLFKDGRIKSDEKFWASLFRYRTYDK